MRRNGIIISIIIGIMVLGISFSFTNVSALSIHSVPNWVKNIASLWSEGKISDKEYLNSTQFLVQNGIIKIPMIVSLQNQVYLLQSQVDDYKKQITYLKNQPATTQSSSSSQNAVAVNSYPINTKCDILVVFSKGEWPINPQGNYTWLLSYPNTIEEIKQLQTKHQQDLTDFYNNLWNNYGAGSCISDKAPSGCENQLNNLEETHQQEINKIVYNPALLNELSTSATIKGHLDILFKQAAQEPGCLERIKKEFPNSTQNYSSQK